MRELYKNLIGTGKPVVLIHGWGMNSAAWGSFPAALAEQGFQVLSLDLPGHGLSQQHELLEFDALVDLLAESIPDASHVLAWSMGGLLATRLAERYPHKVSALGLLSSNPKFVADATWQSATDEAVLNSFAADLEANFAATIKRFLLLQFRGIKGAQAQIRQLREHIIATPPTTEALRLGLDWLKRYDMRPIYTTLRCPVSFYCGDQDTLVPLGFVQELQAFLPAIHAHTFEHAGHALFLTHQAALLLALTEDWHG